MIGTSRRGEARQGITLVRSDPDSPQDSSARLVTIAYCIARTHRTVNRTETSLIAVTVQCKYSAKVQHSKKKKGEQCVRKQELSTGSQWQ